MSPHGGFGVSGRTTGPRPGAWFASEWGIAFLALVLAVLVWAVVWREISSDGEPIDLRLELETSRRFAAFYDGRVSMRLRGPRGEIEEARRVLGSSPVLSVRMPELLADEDHREVAITRDMVAFPFPPRLVGLLDLPPANVYRVREEQIVFEAPELRGLPAGIGYQVTMDPVSAPVRGPAGKLSDGAGSTIRPDPIDLTPYFPEDARDLPGETRIECSFDAWRNDEAQGRYRQDVDLRTSDLRAVAAVYRFHRTATEEVPNRLVFDLPPEYEITVEPTDRYAESRYQGLFEGRQRDLERLKRSTDSWWFVVRVPPDKLPAEGEENATEGFPIEFFRADSLDGLHVRLALRETLIVVIKRRDAP